jgi:hypothetical protein
VDEGETRGQRVALNPEEERVAGESERRPHTDAEPKPQMSGGDRSQRREQDPFAGAQLGRAREALARGDQEH